MFLPRRGVSSVNNKEIRKQQQHGSHTDDEQDGQEPRESRKLMHNLVVVDSIQTVEKLLTGAYRRSLNLMCTRQAVSLCTRFSKILPKQVEAISLQHKIFALNFLLLFVVSFNYFYEEETRCHKSDS